MVGRGGGARARGGAGLCGVARVVVDAGGPRAGAATNAQEEIGPALPRQCLLAARRRGAQPSAAGGAGCDRGKRPRPCVALGPRRRHLHTACVTAIGRLAWPRLLPCV